MKGKCDCGTVEFEVCSEVGAKRLSAVLMATALLTNLTVIKGNDKLSLYRWNTRVARHYLYSICGFYTHHQRRKNLNEYGYNVTCFEGINLASLDDVPMTDGISRSVESNN